MKIQELIAAKEALDALMAETFLKFKKAGLVTAPSGDDEKVIVSGSEFRLGDYDYGKDSVSLFGRGHVHCGEYDYTDTITIPLSAFDDLDSYIQQQKDLVAYEKTRAETLKAEQEEAERKKYKELEEESDRKEYERLSAKYGRSA